MYSINEQNSSVALQHVRMYGTEGREREMATEHDPTGSEKFVPSNEAIHMYMVFRGQDIKDLHVHEDQSDTNITATPTVASATAPVNEAATTATSAPSLAPNVSPAVATATTSTTAAPVNATNNVPRPAPTSSSGRGGGRGGGRSTNHNSDARARTNSNNNTRSAPSNHHNSAKEGTGASLLSRKELGTNVENDPSSTTEDFDFEQAATVADLEHDDYNNGGSNHDEGVDHPTEPSAKTAYSKDDFFDSISCDAIDKQSGIDRRLRGQQERKLNTETFGAVALNSNGNRYYSNNRSRGGGRNNGGGRNSSGRSRGGRGRGYYSNTDNSAAATEGSTNDGNSNSRGGGYRGSGRGSGGRSNYRGGRNTGPRGGSSSSNNSSGRSSQFQAPPTSTSIAANAP